MKCQRCGRELVVVEDDYGPNPYEPGQRLAIRGAHCPRRYAWPKWLRGGHTTVPLRVMPA